MTTAVNNLNGSNITDKWLITLDYQLSYGLKTSLLNKYRRQSADMDATILISSFSEEKTGTYLNPDCIFINYQQQLF